MYKRQGREAEVAVLVAAVLGFVTIAVAYPFHVDTDLWFFVTNGRQILDGWREGCFPVYPTTLAGTTHAGYATIIEQPWPSVVAALAYDGLGALGLKLTVFGYAGLLGVVAYRRLVRRMGRGRWFVALALVGAMLLLGAQWLLVGRPMALTATLLLLLLGVLESSERAGSRFGRPWVRAGAVFALSAVSVRCHAAMWPVGLGVVALWLMSGREARGWTPVGSCRGRSGRWLDVVAYALGGVTTSYGVRLPLYVALSYSSAGSLGITEMRLPAQLSASTLVVVCLAFLLAWACTDGFGRRLGRGGDAPVREVILAALSLVACLTQVRNLPVGLVLMLPLVSTFVADGGMDACVGASGTRGLELRLFWSHETEVRCARAFLVVVGVTVALGLVIAGPAQAGDAQTLMADALLEDAGEASGVRVFTSFNTGAYLRLRGCVVSMDARPELYSRALNGCDDFVDTYREVLSGACDVHELAVAEGCAYVCLDERAEYASVWQVRHETDEFSLVYDDGTFVVAKVL